MSELLLDQLSKQVEHLEKQLEQQIEQVEQISEQVELLEKQFDQLENPDQIMFNKTFTHVLTNCSFSMLSESIIINIFKDGRAFSHFIEPWLALNYPSLLYIGGCKAYDFVNTFDENIKYDQKTFTKGGCKFMPSNMIGEGRKFNKELFDEKAKKLSYIIVSNVHFPEIKVRFVKGSDLIVDYPTGCIPLKDFDKFFN